MYYHLFVIFQQPMTNDKLKTVIDLNHADKKKKKV